ncbi:hypothetical protein B1C78_09215 [Thioalkalivibrio denitrificans]|uniref:5-formyltetrahydrofolate cyclo-ligase n=1 Tax=Thioalkalivibrio denitrificans TaxID=108003 RepID=A0A1V3NHB2_9GAMM|nr:hypothetical protein B1C78_09215 [Thioalkalivibrio denitrificans]
MTCSWLHPLKSWSLRGARGGSAPKTRQPIRPDLLLIPLVGFDESLYRLGYGGGYYDRTIVRFIPRPLVLGIGYDHSRLKTIYPQDLDIPMDRIITESGMLQNSTSP